MTPQPYFQRDGITIYLGDCLEILPQLEPVDHTLTDPPYSEHTHSKQWIGAALTADAKPRVRTAHAGLGFDHLTEDVRRAMAELIVEKCDRWALVFSDLEGAHGWRLDLAGAGLDYVRTCIWDKVDSAPQFTGDRPAAGCEAIVVAHQPGRKRWNGGGRRNVFRHPTNAEPGAKPHPSTKPLPLMKELIALFTDPGDVILDPFGGSMTTAVAAKELGRRCIAIEREEKYCEVGVKRLAQMPLPLEVEAPPKRHSSQLAGGFEWMHTVGAGWLEEETA